MRSEKCNQKEVEAIDTALDSSVVSESVVEVETVGLPGAPLGASVAIKQVAGSIIVAIGETSQNSGGATVGTAAKIKHN